MKKKYLYLQQIIAHFSVVVEAESEEEARTAGAKMIETMPDSLFDEQIAQNARFGEIEIGEINGDL